MANIPQVKLGIVAVSRDCFPIELSQKRRIAVSEAFRKAGGEVFEAVTVVENERGTLRALDELKTDGVNALVVYLGNFGPESPETLLAQRFPGPVMMAGAAEESLSDDERGDAYCGMLSGCLNLQMRGVKVYLPEYPVGTPAGVAAMMASFLPVARVMLGLRGLKIISFGPRPQDFVACNAPIAPLYRLGVEVQENSELDLFAAYNAHAGDPRIEGVAASMAAELGAGNRMPGILPRLAQYEITLSDWVRDNAGVSSYTVMANKCWPAFQTQFGFVPCYVNARFAARLMPIACEVDLYGALSEYLLACATESPATLLDVNNSVPQSVYDRAIAGRAPYALTDLFIGFHCGNTPASMVREPVMKHQLIMKRALEPDAEPNITRGTLEGNLRAGGVTLLRVQPTPEGGLRSYVAQGEVLAVPAETFGARGIFAIREMGRFYRHVMLRGGFPHHAAAAYGEAGNAMWAALGLMGIDDVGFNQPKEMRYPGESPFA